MKTSADLARSAEPGGTPPLALPPDVAALWLIRRGEWDRAHAIVQGRGGRDAAWVHAHLHRIEGDADNAAYWYGRAGRPASTASLDAERHEMATHLLAPVHTVFAGFRRASTPGGGGRGGGTGARSRKDPP